jgi:hypothetical protein
LLTVLLIAAALFSEILTADESPLYPDWVWINSAWVYTGTENPPPPPPPIKPPGTL